MRNNRIDKAQIENVLKKCKNWQESKWLVNSKLFKRKSVI